MTLIEVIISVTILVIVSATTFGYLGGYRRGVDVNTETEKISSYLKQAQSRARNGESGVAWGVHFVNQSGQSYYQLFQGASYNANSIVETIYLTNNVTFTNPANSSTKDIIFQRISGWPVATSSIAIVSKTNGNITKTISINSLGVINY